MSMMLSKPVEQSTAHRTNYWFAILIWIAVIAASFVAVTVAVAQVVIGETRKIELSPQASAKADDIRASYRRPRTIPFPADNPYTFEKVVLGKKLYFDTRLSQGNLLSCASCHSPSYGWGDGQPTGVGHQMKRLGRRSPTIINAAYGLIFMWDGRADTLEEQALGPIQADVEMAMPLDQLLKRLKAIPEYPPLFEAAFSGKGVTAENVARAIATYERTVISGRAPFDAWIEGDERAISDAAKRGFTLFNTKAQCNECHSGWNFTDDSFHDIGLASPDIGRGKHLPEVLKSQHAFKTPGLREITHRAPFMHNGSMTTLEQVIDHYNTAGIDRPSRSELIKPLNLTAQEKADLIAFLKTLTSNMTATAMPVLPR
jgi:cytochrome c peroxidase